ncbi:FKBP-type peptidyl-prolyl cis-trans isomerase, partial [Flavobacteriaceae bacterium]|nr:FKBP-type peptidyl-prolyl cis-trans isomerase [Flavobacteriaceae bacterium]
KGGDAKNFNAPEVFNAYFSDKDQLAKEKELKQVAIKENNTSKFDVLKKETTTTSSGLQYIVTSKGNGAAVSSTNKAMVHYAVYFVDGTLLETSMENVAIANDILNPQRQSAGQYQPIEASVGIDARMIEGFKEGLRLLNEGDKATLFLPYSIAYGADGIQGIPPQSDLIFEVEIVSVTQ